MRDDVVTPTRAVDVRGCVVTLAGNPILRGVDLEVNAGECVIIRGDNGSGKSTLLRVAAGLVVPTAGFAEVLGVAPTSRAVRQRIGAAIDTPAFYGWMSGYGFLRTIMDLSGQRDAGRARGALARFGLASTGRKLVSRYSQGMKKRLALAAASLHDPDLLLLDEPTDTLDPDGRTTVRQWITEQRDRGAAIVVVSHRAEDEALADTIYEMDDGWISSADRRDRQ